MPEVRYYTITQERELKVAANSAIEAAQVATSVFNGDTLTSGEKEVARVLKPMRIRYIVAREDY